MLGKLKRALGIEGVKVEAVLDEVKFKESSQLSGVLKFTTKTENTVESITISIVEKYSRGRGKAKLVDEYTIAKDYLTDEFTITPEEIVEIPFTIDYEIIQSEMDKLQSSNVFARPLVSLAKTIKKVKSEFYFLAEADVKGTTLNPFVKVEINSK